jgi:hypothetical protein
MQEFIGFDPEQLQIMMALGAEMICVQITILIDRLYLDEATESFHLIQMEFDIVDKMDLPQFIHPGKHPK